MDTDQSKFVDDDAPEWASRLLPIPEFAHIVGEHPATVYRKSTAGIYPAIIHIGSSSRLAGWECWDCIKKRMAKRARNEAGAA